MLAEFELIGRVARITDLTSRKDMTSAYLLTVATTKSWPERREWQERTYFRTLTVYEGFESVVKDLEKGDPVCVVGDIVSWSSRDEATDAYTQGVNLVAGERRILARKRQGEVDLDAIPDDEHGEG